MKTNFLIYAFLLVLFIPSCKSFKANLLEKGNKEDLIKNAILDFSETEKMYRKYQVFRIETQLDDDKFSAISINRNNIKILMTSEVKIGVKGKVPSKFFELGDKLFIWYDDEYPLSKDALEVFKKYDLLQSDEDGTIQFPDFVIDDSQKAVHYYFCPDDFTNYVKKITSIGLGYYNPPILRCGD